VGEPGKEPENPASLSPEQLREACRAQREEIAKLSAAAEATRRQLDEARSFSERMAQVAELSRQISGIDGGEIIRVAVTQVPQVFRARYASFFTYDYDRNVLVLRRHNHPEPIDEIVDLASAGGQETLMGYALRHEGPLFIENIETYETQQGIRFRRLKADKYLTNSCILSPLRAGGGAGLRRIVGVLNIADRIDRKPFGPLDLAAAVQISEMIATSLRTCQLVDEMRSLAETDGLTKLRNHRVFWESLDAEIRRHHRYGSPFSVIMLDVDHFKKFNDEHGHLAGDMILAAVARVIKSQIRTDVDVAARYGGEEFTLILPETKLDGAIILARRLRETIQGMHVDYSEKELSITASFGLAQHREQETGSELLNRVDRALFVSKREGRNRVAFSDPDASTNPISDTPPE